MELRTKNTSVEFKELHSKLTELGLYEKGMDLDQMRQVMGAVDESIIETSFNAQDLEFALRESERDFNSANICNSTMIGLSENTNVLESSAFGHCQNNFGSLFSTTFSSPESDCVERITVVAEVHHELNWSPKRSSPTSGGETLKRLARKRNADAMSQEDSGIILSSSSLFETTNLSVYN
ncbi:uncharacterized protein LOC129952258 [Eupeodes corollae]|uniref:uncharacterized protein LOC129952258 n=1 Tax=Eupeodes corollae TaxID=290404 RepID=UPI002491C13E|nr:uncharacterized protein LOC129952258 [Eupeodes corollae]